jgi:hypothetical protein
VAIPGGAALSLTVTFERVSPWASQVSTTMKTVAPARKATPARHAPRSNDSSQSSNATAVINTPEAKASRAAVTAREWRSAKADPGIKR